MEQRTATHFCLNMKIDWIFRKNIESCSRLNTKASRCSLTSEHLLGGQRLFMAPKVDWKLSNNWSLVFFLKPLFAFYAALSFENSR